MWGIHPGIGIGDVSQAAYVPAIEPKKPARTERAVRRLVIERHVEHEARGLLNAIGLLQHCLAGVVATEAERQGWTREINEARQQLERLYAEGLDRNFHVKQ